MADFSKYLQNGGIGLDAILRKLRGEPDPAPAADSTMLKKPEDILQRSIPPKQKRMGAFSDMQDYLNEQSKPVLPNSTAIAQNPLKAYLDTPVRSEMSPEQMKAGPVLAEADDVERNENHRIPATTKEVKPKGLSQEEMGEASDKSDEILPQDKAPEKSAEDKALEDEYAKEDADAQKAGEEKLAESEKEAPAEKMTAEQVAPKAIPRTEASVDNLRKEQERQRELEDIAFYAKAGTKIGSGIGRYSDDVNKSCLINRHCYFSFNHFH